MKKFIAIFVCCLMLSGITACRVQDPDMPHGMAPDISPEVEVPDSDDAPLEEPDAEESENENGVLPDEQDMTAPFVQTVENEEFILTLTADKSVYYVGEEIYCEGVLAPKSYPITVYGSAGLGVYSIEGSAYFNEGQGGGVMTNELGIYTFDGEDRIYPLEKSGGWSASEPNAAFYNAFFADESYLLPAGVYTITLYIHYSTDYDNIVDSQKTMSISYPIEVIDNGTVPEFMKDLPDPLPEYEPVVITYLDKGYGIGTTFDETQAIRAILDKYTDFSNEASDCLFDVYFGIDGAMLYYSTSCGSLYEPQGMGYTHMSKEDKEALNQIVYNYKEIIIELPVEEPVEDEIVTDSE